MSLSTDPRLIQPAPKLTIAQRVAALKRMQDDLALEIIDQDARVWPKGLNGGYTVNHYNGHASVEFNMPAVKEPGFGGGGRRP